MAENKNSFVLYCDLIHTVKKLPKEKQGELFITILEYVNDLNPEVEDLTVDLVFEPIKLQLKRDLKKYENIVERNRINGSKGGRPKNPKKPVGLSGNPKKPKKADTDTDTDTDTDIVNEIDNDKKENMYSDEVHACFKLCLNFFDSHLHPEKNNAWLETIDKLNRIDKIPFNHIERIVELIRSDDFWSKNFLSLTKLRKKNKDGIMYVIVFNEYLKSQSNGNKKSRRQQFAEKIAERDNS